MKRKKMLRLASALITLLLCAAVAYINHSRSAALSATLDEIPDYQGAPYVVLYDNQPDFTEDDLTTKAFESYSPLDLLGRCGTAEDLPALTALLLALPTWHNLKRRIVLDAMERIHERTKEAACE